MNGKITTPTITDVNDPMITLIPTRGIVQIDASDMRISTVSSKLYRRNIQRGELQESHLTAQTR